MSQEQEDGGPINPQTFKRAPKNFDEFIKEYIKWEQERQNYEQFKRDIQ